MKQKFEYIVKRLPEYTIENLNKILNEMSKEGWEVFHIAVPNHYFRREPMVPVSEAVKPETKK